MTRYLLQHSFIERWCVRNRPRDERDWMGATNQDRPNSMLSKETILIQPGNDSSFQSYAVKQQWRDPVSDRVV